MPPVVMKKICRSSFFVRYSVSSDFSEDARNTLFLPVSFALAWKYRVYFSYTPQDIDRTCSFEKQG